LALEFGRGLVEGLPGLHRRTASSGVGAHLVVVTDEAIDLGLQLGNRRAAGLRFQPLLQRLVVALDLALGLEIVGLAVLERDAECGELDLPAGMSRRRRKRASPAP
jgi:hypothetical protein